MNKELAKRNELVKRDLASEQDKTKVLAAFASAVDDKIQHLAAFAPDINASMDFQVGWSIDCQCRFVAEILTFIFFICGI